MAKILIVEDEYSQRKALSDSLNRKKYTVIEACDGEQGLAVALQEHPDIILLDIRMPKMDGMAMMHALRKDVWGKKVPIIILTNYDTKDDQLAQIVIDEPSYYLLKADNSIKQILEKIHEILG